MLKPPDFGPEPGSYTDLLKRTIQGVQQARLVEQMLAVAQGVFEHELEKFQIVLSRPERVRLYRQVLKAVLTDMLAKLDDQNPA